ncbi:TPR-like protein [Ramicandelaber brevisporus]|nr:TPR-like protein [Ramicandelaber brevisporus]
MTSLKALEEVLLLGRDSTGFLTSATASSASSAAVTDLVSRFVKGDYLGILTSDIARDLFLSDSVSASAEAVDAFKSTGSLGQLLGARAAHFVSNASNVANSENERAFIVLMLAASALYALVQEGWTGPALISEDSPLSGQHLARLFVPSSVLSQTFGVKDSDKADAESLKQLDAAIRKNLACDGESVYHLLPHPILLGVAHALLVEAVGSWTGSSQIVSVAWWSMRCAVIRQQVLENATETLLLDIQKLYGTASTVFNASYKSSAASVAKSNDEELYLAARLEIEYAQALLLFRQTHQANQHITQASRFANFAWKVTGALGKRTKFQDVDVAQLVVEAHSTKDTTAAQAPSGDAAAVESAGVVPSNLAHEDDAMLENIKLADDTSLGMKNLDPIHQCILLCKCMYIRATNAADVITKDEMMAFVERVLKNPNNWSVYSFALLMRSRLEAEKSRMLVRSIMQLEQLVKQTGLQPTESKESELEAAVKTKKKAQQDASAGEKEEKEEEENKPTDRIAGPAERVEYAIALMLPSIWEMERELGTRQLSYGLVRSACELFTRLEMWDEVIQCYQAESKQHEAERVVRTRISVEGETPKLLTLLGDLQNKPELWQKAWDVSGQRYSRAARALGAYYIKQQQWQDALTWYQRAMKVNSLFPNSWFVLGCAAMHLSEWSTALNAFTRVVQLEHDNGEAWTNIASVYLRLDKPSDARRALEQAIKYKDNDHRIVINYMYACWDEGRLNDVIRAFGKIVDMRWRDDGARCVDVGMLRRIVDAIKAGKTEADDAADPSADAGDSEEEEVAGIANVGAIDLGDSALASTASADTSDADSKAANIASLNQAARERRAAFLASNVENLLVGNITSRITSVPEIWFILGDFELFRKRAVRAFNAFSKAYRAEINAHNDDLESNKNAFESVASAALKMVNVYELAQKELAENPAAASAPSVASPTPSEAEGESGEDETITTAMLEEWKYQLKRLLNGLVRRTRDSFEDTETHEKLTDITKEL